MGQILVSHPDASDLQFRHLPPTMQVDEVCISGEIPSPSWRVGPWFSVLWVLFLT